jgi:predicted metal-dependent phosphoesterase TrpH
LYLQDYKFFYYWRTNMNYGIDLHHHSNIWDGMNSTREIVLHLLNTIRNNAMVLAATTDHNNFWDNDSRKIIYEENLGIFVPWIEISTSQVIFDGKKETDLHITAYGEFPYNQELEEILNNTRTGKSKKTYERLGIIIEKFWLVWSPEDCRRFLLKTRGARDLKSKHFIWEYLYSIVENRNTLNKLFPKGHEDFYRQIFEEDWEYRKSCKVEGFQNYKPSVAEVTRYLPKGTIIALPHLQISFRKDFEEGNIEKIKNLVEHCISNGWINAIEINSKASKKDVETILSLADEYKLILTMWSDNHWIWHSDSRHWELWEQNEHLDQLLINKIAKNFLLRLWI